MTFYYEKKFNIFLIMLFSINHSCSGLTTEYPTDLKPVSTNIPDAAPNNYQRQRGFQSFQISLHNLNKFAPFTFKD